MKKWLVALCMTICLVSLTACGSSDADVKKLSDTDAVSLATSAVQMVSGVVAQGMEEMYVAQVEQSGENGQVYKNAFDSWTKAQKDMGDFLGTGDLISNEMEVDAMGNCSNGTINLELKGSERDAELEVVIKRGKISSITTNVNYTFGEGMKKAGLNTLLGMGTVFVVLILISFIISAFNLIPKVQSLFTKKASPKEKAVDETITQIIAKEEQSDDLELVAAISAAIAAFEGTSSDGFVVRSIRKVR